MVALNQIYVCVTLQVLDTCHRLCPSWPELSHACSKEKFPQIILYPEYHNKRCVNYFKPVFILHVGVQYICIVNTGCVD